MLHMYPQFPEAITAGLMLHGINPHIHSRVLAHGTHTYFVP